MDHGLPDFEDRLAALESEVFRLRSDYSAAREAQTRGAGAPASPEVHVPTANVPLHPAAPPAPRRRATMSLEALVAGRGLQLVGLLLVLLGAAFFLDLAFTRGWIGPAERILLGLVGGAAIVAAGARALRGVWRYLAEGLVGLGSGILYLSIWASVAVFPQLHVARGAAFAAMIAVTAFLAALAARSRSERVAILGLIGGLLTPALLAAGPIDHVVLAGYLVSLAVVMFSLSAMCAFWIADVVGFLGILAYAPSFAPDATWTDVDALIVATLLFVVFAVTLSTPRPAERPSAPGVRAALIAIAAGAYAAVIEAIFQPKPLTLGISLIVLAAALLTAARARVLPLVLQATYAYAGLGALTLALPAILHDTMLLDAFFIEALLLFVAGTRMKSAPVVVIALLVYGYSALALLVLTETNPGFTYGAHLYGAFAIAIAALIGARALSTPLPRGIDRALLNKAMTIVLTVLLFAGTTRLCLDVIGGPLWNGFLSSRAEFALSALWTLIGAVLFACGMRFGSALLRWEALILFAITVLKVFAVDLSELQAEYRVGSFVGLGIVLVAVSTWYTRAAVARKTEADA